jgi:ABC-type glycerol-3-phosphate transport system substrate-binding protein
MKKFIAALLAGLTLFTLVGCSGGSKADSSTPKDYSQIIHDARSDEDNEYDMIFTKGEDGLPLLTVTAPSTRPTS